MSPACPGPRPAADPVLPRPPGRWCRRSAAAPKQRPDPRPMRLVLGAGTIAAVSIMAAGLVRFPAATGDTSGDAIAADGAAADAAVVETLATARPEVRIKHRTVYVHLKRGQKAPKGAKVITGKAPPPRVVVTRIPAKAATTRTHAAGHPPGGRDQDPPVGPLSGMTIAAPPPATTRGAGTSGRPLRAERTLTVPAMGGSLTLRVAHRPRGRGCRRRQARDPGPGAGRGPGRIAGRPASPASPTRRTSPRSTPTRAGRDVACGRRSPRCSPGRSGRVDLCPDLLDVTLLDERLAAEAGADSGRPAIPPPSPLRRAAGPAGTSCAEPGAASSSAGARSASTSTAWPRAGSPTVPSACSRRYPAAMVDADGDIALRLGDDIAWDIAIADPRRDDGVAGGAPARRPPAGGLRRRGHLGHQRPPLAGRGRWVAAASPARSTHPAAGPSPTSSRRP